MRRPVMIVLGLSVFALIVCACKTTESRVREETAYAAPSGRVRVVVSVDWEGRALIDEALTAMVAFRNDYPDIPLQHFLNAAYYTKAGVDADTITRKVRRALRPGDEQGLHIHPWKTLVERSGVTFRYGPSFVKDDVQPSECAVDCGQHIALTAYTVAETRRMIDYSTRLLVARGFDRPVTFRAGGWQSDEDVLTALALEGFWQDASATRAAFLKKSWGPPLRLYDLVLGLWPDISSTSQPYTIALGENLSITEFPDNGCLADYMTGVDMLNVFIANAEAWRGNPDRDVVVSIGFHQETAHRYLPALREGIERIREYAHANSVPLEFGLLKRGRY